MGLRKLERIWVRSGLDEVRKVEGWPGVNLVGSLSLG